MKILKRNDLYENFEKRGGSREKGGGGNEIHAPCACVCDCKFNAINMRHLNKINLLFKKKSLFYCRSCKI